MSREVSPLTSTARQLNPTVLLMATILAFTWQRHLDGQQRFSVVLPHDYSAAAASFRSFDGPKPLVVSLCDHFTSDTVIGGSTPDVVLYDDGMLIYRKFDASHPSYEFQQLGQNKLAEFKRRIAAVLDSNEIDSQYDIAPNQTSRPRTCFLFDDGHGRVVTQVRGLYTLQIQPPPPQRVHHEVNTEAFPAKLVEMHRFLRSQKTRRGRAWVPRYVEVLLWPHRRDVTQGIAAWPSTWPGLDSTAAVTVRDAVEDREMHALFLRGNRLGEVEQLLTGDIRAIRLAGRQWQFAIRHVFPSEDRWRIPFNERLIDAFRKKKGD